jgi:murein DD-endopeptidase MepM/ murein hydrolase activator NlpD
MSTGTLILAARAGTVTMVKDDSNIAGFNITYASDANYVVIDHGDGTQALYLHIMKGGALVHIGEQVVQGQPIALSGDTGWTSGPHLHFVVEQASNTHHLTQSIPISFRDVNDWGGVPQPGRWYTSQNVLRPPIPPLPPLTYSTRITPIQAIATSIEGAKQDYNIPYGHFFKEANGHGGQGITGYIVTDDHHIPFWTDFPSLGGVTMLGYPIGDRFTFDGFVVQPFQKAVLQWNPATKSFGFLNVLDILHNDGYDAWLQAYDQIPPPLDTSPDTGLSWPAIIQRHLTFLNGNQQIKSYVLNTPDWLNRFGLPMSRIVNEGPDLVVRFQRAAIQLWKISEPWAAAGQITIVNGGDLLKAKGLLPPTSIGYDYAPVP